MSAAAPLAFPGTDDALRRAVEGDHEAFAALVREHEDAVYSIAWHFLRDRQRAEEIAQDVFLQLYRALGELESPAHVARWVRRVAANRCIDEARRGRWRLVTLDDAPEPAHEAEQGDPLLDRRIRALLQQLPPAQRLAIILRYQEELEPAEIGAALGIPVNTIKSHLRRGLAALREWLGVTP